VFQLISEGLGKLQTVGGAGQAAPAEEKIEEKKEEVVEEVVEEKEEDIDLGGGIDLFGGDEEDDYY
jgi:ribosomal protein L12E/L44/L45/RPP1/RPP2